MENLFNYLKHEYNGEFKTYNISTVRKIYSFKIVPASVTAIYRLPEWLEHYINEAEFALSDNALKTIKHLFDESVKYSSEPLFRHYDTSIREMLLSISHTMIEKAVLLLTDYYYDKNTLYYVDSSINFISRNTLSKLILYQLWAGRTGRGLQLRYSNLEYDEHYIGDTYYQNDYWLKKILENEEKIQEDKILTDQNILIDEDEEYAVERATTVNSVSCSRYDITIMYYRQLKNNTSNDEDMFENNFENDIPERLLVKYKVVHYNESSALRLAFNKFSFDIFTSIYKSEINPIYKLTYNVELIREHIDVYEPSIDILKS